MEYFNSMGNIIDFSRNAFYISTILIRTAAYIQVISEDPPAANIRREEWDTFDLTFIADGLFAAGNVFAFLKLVHLFSINQHLGPVQISLGRMVIDIIKFFFIYTLVLFAFACGLNQLLWYYAEMEKHKCYSAPNESADWEEQRDSCLTWRRFSNLFESIQTLFWASFGLIELSNFELKGIKGYTRYWGMLMFGSYCVVNVVVLLTLLIAMMSNSYQMISEQADTEWKFARTKLFMDYFHEDNVPPPFNIIPTMKAFLKVFRSKNVSDQDDSRRTKTNRNVVDSRYQSVIRNLVWRYVTSQQRSAENHNITEDDIKEVRQDISSFRYELLDVLRGSGMNTPCIHLNKPEATGKKSKIRQRRLLKDFMFARAEVDIYRDCRISEDQTSRVTDTTQKWRDNTHARSSSLLTTHHKSSRESQEDVHLESYTNPAIDLRSYEEDYDKKDSGGSQIELMATLMREETANEYPSVVIAQPIMTDEAADQLFAFESVGDTPDDSSKYVRTLNHSQDIPEIKIDSLITSSCSIINGQSEVGNINTTVTFAGTSSGVVSSLRETSTAQSNHISNSQVAIHTIMSISPSQTVPLKQYINQSVGSNGCSQTASSFEFGWI